MSWYAKVNWSEGLFLRPHHLQQADRYLENALESRVRHVTPYPWGFATLELDRDLAQQSKFALRKAAGVMPDGSLFDFPADSPAPGADRGARNGGRPARLALDAGQSQQFARSQSRQVGQRGAVRRRLRNGHRFDLASARRGGNRRRLSASRLRDPQDRQAGLCRAADRADRRSARPNDRLRREIRASAARLRRSSDRRGVARPGDRLDRQQARRTRALRQRRDRGRRPAKRGLSDAADAEPRNSGAQAFSPVALCPS